MSGRLGSLPPFPGLGSASSETKSSQETGGLVSLGISRQSSNFDLGDDFEAMIEGSAAKSSKKSTSAASSPVPKPKRKDQKSKTLPAKDAKDAEQRRKKELRALGIDVDDDFPVPVRSSKEFEGRGRLDSESDILEDLLGASGAPKLRSRAPSEERAADIADDSKKQSSMEPMVGKVPSLNLSFTAPAEDMTMPALSPKDERKASISDAERKAKMAQLFFKKDDPKSASAVDLLPKASAASPRGRENDSKEVKPYSSSSLAPPAASTPRDRTTSMQEQVTPSASRTRSKSPPPLSPDDDILSMLSDGNTTRKFSRAAPANPVDTKPAVTVEEKKDERVNEEDLPSGEYLPSFGGPKPRRTLSRRGSRSEEQLTEELKSMRSSTPTNEYGSEDFNFSLGSRRETRKLTRPPVSAGEVPVEKDKGTGLGLGAAKSLSQTANTVATGVDVATTDVTDRLRNSNWSVGGGVTKESPIFLSSAPSPRPSASSGPSTSLFDAPVPGRRTTRTVSDSETHSSTASQSLTRAPISAPSVSDVLPAGPTLPAAAEATAISSAAHVANTSELLRLKSELSQLETTNMLLKRERERALDDVTAAERKLKQEVTLLREEFELKQSSMRAEFELERQRFGALERSLREDVDRLKSRHEDELRLVQEASKLQIKTLSEEKERLLQDQDRRLKMELDRAKMVEKQELESRERQFERTLQNVKQLHESELEAVKRQHNEQLHILSLANKVQESASALDLLAKRVDRDKTTEEYQREEQLIARERILKELETRLKEQQREVEEQRRRMETQMQHAAEEHARTSKELDMERERLAHEHDRMASLQLTIRNSDKSSREDISREKQRLQEEREALSKMKAEMQLEFEERKEMLEAEETRLKRERGALNAAQSTINLARQSTMRRLREAEVVMLEDQDSVGKERLLLEEKKVQIQREKEELEKLRDQIDSDKKDFEQEASRLTHLGLQVQEKSESLQEMHEALQRERGDIEKLRQEAMRMQMQIREDKARLDEQTKNLAAKQKSFEMIRVQSARQQKQVEQQRLATTSAAEDIRELHSALSKRLTAVELQEQMRRTPLAPVDQNYHASSHNGYGRPATAAAQYGGRDHGTSFPASGSKQSTLSSGSREVHRGEDGQMTRQKQYERSKLLRDIDQWTKERDEVDSYIQEQTRFLADATVEVIQAKTPFSMLARSKTVTFPLSTASSSTSNGSTYTNRSSMANLTSSHLASTGVISIPEVVSTYLSSTNTSQPFSPPETVTVPLDASHPTGTSLEYSDTRSLRTLDTLSSINLSTSNAG